MASTLYCLSFWVAPLLLATATATTNLASWQGLRGAQIQSKIVLEGGLLTNGTFQDSQWKGTSIVQHSYGIFYFIDLTQSFDSNADDTSTYLLPGVQETTNTLAPIYIDGGIFHNDYQFYTWGGIATQKSIGYSSVLLGNVFPPSPQATRFDQGISPNQPTDGVNDNITSGAYASAPDQGLGFYFGGMVSANKTYMEYSSSDDAPDHPTVASTTFTMVDMTDPNNAKFSSLAWPNGTTSRSEGGLVWLPYGKKGVLVAIGGVEIPGDLFLVSPPKVTANSTFMTSLLIYDIDAQQWYTQQTLETAQKPTQLASFCTAVVPTQDNKSFEIFVYGGYDGTYASDNPNVRDDVWVLSVPAFQWTKVVSASPSSLHGRQGSICFAPNPTTMITIGGTDVLGGSLKSDSLIDVLDLNSLNWTGKYNSSSADLFVAPDSIVRQLNWVDGKGPGSSPVRGLNSTLNDLFSTPYTGEVQTYYPYSTYNASTGSETPTNGTSTKPETSSEPKWKIPVIATLCTVGGLAIIAAIMFFCLRKRRQASRQHHRKNHSGVFAWLSKSSHSTSDGQTEKWTDAGESTAIGSDADYFNNAKTRRNTDIYEVTGDVGSPDAVTPAGTAMTSAISRSSPQELGGASTNMMATSTTPLHNRNTSGLLSESGTDSYMGRPFVQRSTSIHELPQGKSEEDLPLPAASSMAAGTSNRPDSSANQPLSAVSEHPTSNGAISPGLTVVNDNVSISERSSSPVGPNSSPPRPYHHRNQSSLDDHLPDLPSPPTEEDKRLSRQLDGLPDLNSPLSPPLPPLNEHTSRQH